MRRHGGETVDFTHFPSSDERRTLVPFKVKRYKNTKATSKVSFSAAWIGRLTDSENHSNWEFHIVFGSFLQIVGLFAFIVYISRIHSHFLSFELQWMQSLQTAIHTVNTLRLCMLCNNIHRKVHQASCCSVLTLRMHYIVVFGVVLNVSVRAPLRTRRHGLQSNNSFRFVQSVN